MSHVHTLTAQFPLVLGGEGNIMAQDLFTSKEPFRQRFLEYLHSHSCTIHHSHINPAIMILCLPSSRPKWGCGWVGMILSLLRAVQSVNTPCCNSLLQCSLHMCSHSNNAHVHTTPTNDITTLLYSSEWARGYSSTSFLGLPPLTTFNASIKLHTGIIIIIIIIIIVSPCIIYVAVVCNHLVLPSVSTISTSCKNNVIST